MKNRIGPYAAAAWIFTIWMGVAFWIESVTRIPRGWPVWVYVLLNAIAVGFVEHKFETRISRRRLQEGLPIRMKLTGKRLLILALVAVLWCVEYFAILVYAPHLIAGDPMIVTFSLFWILPLIVATVLEMSWLKQDAG